VILKDLCPSTFYTVLMGAPFDKVTVVAKV